ncbi:MAG: hypothetical protein ABJG47_08700 [Ekhidna sp.]
MIKYITQLAIIFLFTGSVNAQFEGRIKFDISYQWKLDDGLTTEQFTQYMGDKMEYFSKGAYYKSNINGMIYTTQIYSPKENRLYNVINENDTLVWINAAINTDTVLNYSIEDSDEVILGYKCQVFVIETTRGTGKYYFSKEIGVDPELYKNHNYGNFALVTSRTKSLSLKIEIDNESFNMLFEAVEVKDMNIDDSFFKIPDLPSKETPNY